MAESRAGNDALILVVDDAPQTLELLRRNLSGAGYRVLTATRVDDAVAVLEAETVDLVVTDMKMPGASGLDLVRHVRANCPETEVMMITGYASIEGAVTAVKAGADEYLAKPFTDEELLSAVRHALSKRRLLDIGQGGAGAEAARRYGFIGCSPAMAGVWEAIEKAAATDATVLITGESGTGKELVARAVHYSGSRAAAAFVPVNCGGIPEGLLESELFGHIKGAFTGATESRAGFFQTAEGGSIFLDEISETSLAMQVKLLRVLEDRQVRMVGATTSRELDVRIIAATNKDLLGLVEKGKFRDDLYFRLNVVPIAIPPLRARGDDILLLVSHFASKYADEFARPAPQFSEDALQVLRDYAWPGNVRELQNLVQRLVVLVSRETIDVADLPSPMRFSVARDNGLDRSLSEVEQDYIRRVLARVGGNKTRAAAILGIDRKTLREKLKEKDGQSD